MKLFFLTGLLTLSACLIMIGTASVGLVGEIEALPKVALRASSATVDETLPAGLKGIQNPAAKPETATNPSRMESLSLFLLGMGLLLLGGVLRGKLNHRVLDSVLMPKTLECENNVCK